MKILFIDQNFDATNIGGAFKSNYAIIKEFIKNPMLEVSVLATKARNLRNNNFSVKQITPILNSPSKKINSLIKMFKINQYFNLLPIFKEVKRFKPNVIIVQRDNTFSALLTGFLLKVPVINIIRDAMEFCPKNIDTKGFRNCSIKLSKKECWECIHRWRTLRMFFEDKPKGSHKTLRSSFYTIYYKVQYFFTKIKLSLMKYAYVNVVASPLMKELVEKRVKSNRILIKKITPIDKVSISITSINLSKAVIEKIEHSRKIILFIIPRNEGGSKGYPFVKKLLKRFPKDYLILIIGTIIKELKNYQNVININKIPTNNLYYLYQKADLTLVPSIYTEAFGRVVLESIINKTPVIISPQTGANFLFKNKNFVKILPLKPEIWLKGIEKILKNPVNILEEDVKDIENMFSPQNCAKDIMNLMKKIKT